VRPPDWRWGSYYWYPRWGWYHVAAVAGATLAFVTTLPDDPSCEQLLYEGESLYRCNSVLYRPTYYQDERVYEVVSSQDESGAVVETDEVLRLTTPRMRGERVLALQNALASLGYEIGRVDGIYGPATDTAVRTFQEAAGLAVTGEVDEETARALGEAFSEVFVPDVSGSEKQ